MVRKLYLFAFYISLNTLHTSPLNVLASMLYPKRVLFHQGGLGFSAAFFLAGVWYFASLQAALLAGHTFPSLTPECCNRLISSCLVEMGGNKELRKVVAVTATVLSPTVISVTSRKMFPPK